MTDNTAKSDPKVDNNVPDEAAGTALDEEGQEKEFEFVEDPVFDITYKGDCAYEVKVVVPAANEQKQSDELYGELKHEAIVPGFRKGRAPIKLIQKKFEKYVKSEVESRLVTEAFRKLVKDQDLRPISTPDIEELDKEKPRGADEPFAFTLKFEVAPRASLGPYRGIEVVRPIRKITEKDIDENIEALRSRYAVYEPLKEGKAEPGDQVVIDFTGTVDGSEFRGGSGRNYPYILGTRRFFPEFEHVLEGASAGDELECEVTLPSDYFREELRGKKARFSIQVREVRRKNIPEINEDFAKLAGHASLAELRAATEQRLVEAARERAQEALERNAIEAVIAASTFEIPNSLIESTTEEYFQEEVRRLLAARVPMDTIREREDELRARAREAGIRDIQRVVALREISEAEGLAVTDEDLEQDIETASERTGIDSKTLENYLDENEDRRSAYMARILRAKALKIIVENARITDQEVSADEEKTETEDGHEG